MVWFGGELWEGEGGVELVCWLRHQRRDCHSYSRHVVLSGLE